MITVAMPQMGNDLFRRYMKSKYVAVLRRAGARAVWIPLENEQAAVAAALACDGLLLPGGADIAPALYGEEPGERCGRPHALRDRYEPLLLDAFLTAGKPVLGICRGLQMLNVCRGGSLQQDIAGLQKCRHSDFIRRGRGVHSVQLTPGTQLAEIFGCDTLQVNSIHHQAVKKPGSGLAAAATSSDGFVEAAELTGHPFCIAVQWHPEHMERDAVQQKLIRAFVEACEK